MYSPHFHAEQLNVAVLYSAELPVSAHASVHPTLRAVVLPAGLSAARERSELAYALTRFERKRGRSLTLAARRLISLDLLAGAIMLTATAAGAADIADAADLLVVDGVTATARLAAALRNRAERDALRSLLGRTVRVQSVRNGRVHVVR